MDLFKGSEDFGFSDFRILCGWIEKYKPALSKSAYLYSQLMKLLLTSRNMDYHRKNLTYLKQVYTSQSNHIKFENPKSSLSLKRSIVPLLTILNPMKPKVR